MKRLNKLLIALIDYVKASSFNPESINESKNNLYFGSKSFEDYRCYLKIILLEVYIDEWSVEKAYTIFMEIDEYYCSVKCEDLIEIIYANLSYTLARELTAANMHAEAINVFNKTNEVLIKAKHYMAYKKIHLMPEASKEEIRNIIKQIKRKFDNTLLIEIVKSIYGIGKPRLLMNHFRKTENCYRLGIIDEARYKNSINRLIKNHRTLIDKENLVIDFLNSRAFARLPTCVSMLTSNKINNIQWPGSYELEPSGTEYHIMLFDRLSSAQKIEYLKAFSKEGSYELLCKYNGIRYNDILVSILLYHERIDNLDDIIYECELFIKLGGKTVFVNGFEAIATLCKKQLQTSQSEWIKKLNIIKYVTLFYNGKNDFLGNILIFPNASFDKSISGKKNRLQR